MARKSKLNRLLCAGIAAFNLALSPAFATEQEPSGPPITPRTQPLIVQGLDDVLHATTTSLVVQGLDAAVEVTTAPLVVTGMEEGGDIVEEIEPQAEPAPQRSRFSKTKIMAVKLLQVRATSRGGSLPFVVKDIEEAISPKAILASLSEEQASEPVTCAAQTFPGTGFSNGPILVRFPDDGGACEIGTAVAEVSEVAFTISPDSASTATIASQNGWSVDLPDIAYNVGSTFANTLVITRGGLSYTMGVDAQGTGIGASFPIFITVTSFSGPS